MRQNGQLRGTLSVAALQWCSAVGTHTLSVAVPAVVRVVGERIADHCGADGGGETGGGGDDDDDDEDDDAASDHTYASHEAHLVRVTRTTRTMTTRRCDRR
jgi:hypothetical protein